MYFQLQYQYLQNHRYKLNATLFYQGEAHLIGACQTFPGYNTFLLDPFYCVSLKRGILDTKIGHLRRNYASFYNDYFLMSMG